MRPDKPRGPRTSAVLLALALAALCTRSILAQPGVQGRWRTLPSQMPINPIHLALMNNGKVLIVAGSGNVENVTSYEGAVWDPQTGVTTTHAETWDMFCNGLVALPDGRIFIQGGTLHYLPFFGLPNTSLYDPATGDYSDVQSTAHGRWYPTVTTLGDGRILTFSGLNETGDTNSTVEIFTLGSGWSPEYPAGWTPPLYPRLHLLPNGLVFYSGSTPASRFFNPSTNAWTGVVANTKYAGTRLYGSSVLLPLMPGDNYRPRVLILGGGDPGTATTEIIDLSAPMPAWQNGPPMSQPRIEGNATLLPTGNVLVTGGSAIDEEAATASLNADLYNPTTNTFSPAGANAFPRLYHSGALLLPDATVLVLGGNPQRGTFEPHLEIYSPAYLYNANGTLATRPTISSVAPGTFAYGDVFQVQTPDAANIASAVLLRPGAPTHSFDMDQRLVGLSFTAGSGVLNVTAPPTANIAPPGYYMLFLLNAAGVPSVASFVRLAPTSPAQRPTAIINTPTIDAKVDAGGAAFFAGTGTDPQGGSITGYSWSFPGGNPASSTAASPGNVIYSTPGIYVASLTVTNNLGLTSQIPATRIVTVPDFAIWAGNATKTALPGRNASFPTLIVGGSGFTGTVTFNVSGLPAGASATFTPPSVVSSGGTVMNVTTLATTPLGTYPLTITGTSGLLSHNTGATLVVSTCDDRLNVTYAAGTLNLGFSLGTMTPGTWNTWLVAQNTPYNLWSLPVPIVNPAMSFTIPIPNFPSLGTVYVITSLTNAQTTCSDVKAVNTSP